MTRSIRACAVLLLLLAATFVRADDGLPVQADATGTIALDGDKVVLKAGAVTYEVTSEDPAQVLGKFPGSTVHLYGEATKVTDQQSQLSVLWMDCPGGDVFDDPTVPVARGQVPKGKVRPMFAAQDPDTKQWWVRIAYEGGPLVSNEESWVKAEVLFAKPAPAPGDVAPVTTTLSGTLAVENGKTVLRSGDATYTIENEQPAAALAPFAGTAVTLSGGATKTGDESFELSVASMKSPKASVYDDASASLAPRGEVPAGTVFPLGAAQDPTTLEWFVEVAYPGGPAGNSARSFVKASALFAPSKTAGVTGAIR